MYEYVVVVVVVVAVFKLFCCVFDVLEKLLFIKIEVMWYLLIEVKGEFVDLLMILFELVIVFYLIFVVCGMLMDVVREVI